ncbi:hypothetical protein M5X11_33450 [Paenibacillus alginolyticus]|uniref:hypothetical protein n=1 Tax=Paenibacillus alginolyticus TaxID=59839 RepID=UPI000FD72953|nr:hypothetical protein [Paenibacillus alginolyticus]MCY9669761.1 hypothetical protein [Paenibacillus alginolyticus]
MSALFDHFERSGGKKRRNNALSFLFPMISGVFRPNSESTFPSANSGYLPRNTNPERTALSNRALHMNSTPTSLHDAPYGITNERLDEVSNYYRYNGRKSDTWQKTQATATATVTNGIVTGVTITNPGAGYSSNPTITVTGPNGTFTATATLAYTKDFKTNGSISAITIK